MGASEPGGGRPDEADSGEEGGRDEEDRGRGGRNGVRFEAGTAPESQGLEDGGSRTDAPLYHASHRERRMVDESVGKRGLSALSGFQSGIALALAGAGVAVCRFRRLAARLSDRRGPGERGRLLEGAT